MAIEQVRSRLEERREGSGWLHRDEVDALGCDRYDIVRNSHREIAMRRLLDATCDAIAAADDPWAGYAAGIALLAAVDPRDHAGELVEPDEALLDWIGLSRNSSYLERARIAGGVRPGSAPLHFLREAQYLYWLTVVDEAARALQGRLAAEEQAAYDSSAWAGFDEWTVDDAPGEAGRETLAG